MVASKGGWGLAAGGLAPGATRAFGPLADYTQYYYSTSTVCIFLVPASLPPHDDLHESKSAANTCTQTPGRQFRAD
jgi:hypothetical protein